MNLLKKERLNRQKLLLSPGTGNLRSQRVDNEGSLDELDSETKTGAASKQGSKGDQLLNQLNAKCAGPGSQGQIGQKQSFGQSSEHSQHQAFLRQSSAENSFSQHQISKQSTAEQAKTAAEEPQQVQQFQVAQPSLPPPVNG